MTRSPGSQRREVMQRKERMAQELLKRGLSVTQVAAQIGTSRAFVRRVRSEMTAEDSEGARAS